MSRVSWNAIARGFIAALMVGSAACGSTIPALTPASLVTAQRQWPSVTLADLERGRALYLERCSSCHTPFVPRQFAAQRWPALVGQMRTNAKLTSADEQDIVRYLVVESASRP
jgi:hypothetical protein